MRLLYILFFLLFLLAWCWLGNHSYKSEEHTNPSKKVISNNKKLNFVNRYSGWFDLQKYNAWIERDLFLWNEKILSWMNQVMKQVKNNIQVFNQQWLEEFKEMLALHEENVKLMQQLVSLQKKRYDCFVKKYDLLNPKQILNNVNQKVKEVPNKIENVSNKKENINEPVKELEENKVVNKQVNIIKEDNPVINNKNQKQATWNNQFYSDSNKTNENNLNQNNSDLKNKSSTNIKLNNWF